MLRVASISPARRNTDRAPHVETNFIAHVIRVAGVLVGTGTAALDHEVRRNAMEGQSVVIAFTGTARDADRRERSGINVEADIEGAESPHVEAKRLAAQRVHHGHGHTR